MNKNVCVYSLASKSEPHSEPRARRLKQQLLETTGTLGGGTFGTGLLSTSQRYPHAPARSASGHY
eukprot:1317960-Heterocapsa_arctica.AAC.1